MIHVPVALDPFDPRSLPVYAPDDVVSLCLSARIDCHCILDRQDYEWAVGDPNDPQLWCHTYGSGSYNPETDVIDRPDHIYARRSILIPGRKTPQGRPSYGNEWLHRCICLRAYGASPLDYVIADHLNGDTLDNRRCNLRWATRSMNAGNTRGSATRERFLRELGMAKILSEAA